MKLKERLDYWRVKLGWCFMPKRERVLLQACYVFTNIMSQKITPQGVADVITTNGALIDAWAEPRKLH